MLGLEDEDDDGTTASAPVKKAEPKKPLLEKGSEQWKQAINHLLKGTVTIDAIKAKYTLLEPNEDELIALTKTTNKPQ